MGRVLALLALAMLVPVSTAEEGQEQGGVLYLTAQELTGGSDITCLGQAKRYQMGMDVPEEGAVRPTGLSKPTSSCPMRFVFDVTSPFQLGDFVNLTMHVRCTATIGPPREVEELNSFTFFLTNDPAQRGQDPSDPLNLFRAPDGAVSISHDHACLEQEFTLEIPVPGRNLTLEPGGILTLFVWVHYTTPPDGMEPAIEFLVGGADASRLEAPALPAPVAAAELGDLRPRLLWTSDPNGDTWRSCGSLVPVHAMVPPSAAPAADAVAANTATPVGAGCYTRFEYTAAVEVTLTGPITTTIWFRCDSPSYGSPAHFVVRHMMVDGDGTARPIAPQAQTAPNQAPEACPQTPVQAPPAHATIDTVARLQPGHRLRTEVFPVYLVPPHQEQVQTVQYLVGPEQQSALAVAGLPWGAPPLAEDTSSAAPQQEGKKVPLPPAVAAVLAALVLARSRSTPG